MARLKNSRNAIQLLADIKKYADGTKTITEIARQVRTSHCWAKRLCLNHNIPFHIKRKELTDVQRHLISKEASPEKSVKYLSRKHNSTYYAVKMFMDEEKLPYKSYVREKVKESKTFNWDDYENGIF